RDRNVTGVQTCALPISNDLYPVISIWENVMGAFSSNDRMDFRAVLSAFTDTEIPMPASGRWASAGMVRGGCPDLAWRLLDAQHRSEERRVGTGWRGAGR